MHCLRKSGCYSKSSLNRDSYTVAHWDLYIYIYSLYQTFRLNTTIFFIRPNFWVFLMFNISLSPVL